MLNSERRFHGVVTFSIVCVQSLWIDRINPSDTVSIFSHSRQQRGRSRLYLSGIIQINDVQVSIEFHSTNYSLTIIDVNSFIEIVNSEINNNPDIQ